MLTAVKRYDYLVVDVPWTRIAYDNFGNFAEVDAFASAPEYGPGRVVAVGFKIKQDGTRGRQLVKPVLNVSACPADVRAAFNAAGYPSADH